MENEKEYVWVDRSDNCIWINDNRGKFYSMHLTVSQAKDIAQQLLDVVAND